MENLDNFRERMATLEQHTAHVIQQTRTVERRLRWWRGLACGLLLLSLLSLALPSGKAADPEPGEVAARVAALEQLLTHFSREGNEVFITGANLHLVNGLGRTDCRGDQGEPIPDCPNGLGNLIVGYNELRPFEPNVRTGSHNVVVGRWHNFSRFGGAVVGSSNEISGAFASVTGGLANRASGDFASVSGGNNSRASGEASSISGGIAASTPGLGSAVSGGQGNTASGIAAAVSGGYHNTASAIFAAVSGGGKNTASGEAASVSGGGSDRFSSEPGNTASGSTSSVSGGRNRTAPGQFDWAAGDFFADF